MASVIRRLRTALGTALGVQLSAVVASLVALAGGAYQKAPCRGPVLQDRCYSDIVYLWGTRDLGAHALPYVHGGITVASGSVPHFTGHELEYPVLTGLFVWFTSLSVQTAHAFFVASVLWLTPFAVATAWMLSRLVGRRALLFAAAPTLVWYSFLNWDLPPVALTVGAIYAWRRDRVWLAGFLLGIGGCLKLWPGFLLVPLLADLWLRGRRRDGLGALMAAGAVAVTVNLPFVLINFAGWRAPFTFQSLRSVDTSANSIWRYLSPEQLPSTSMVNHLSALVVGAMFLFILLEGKNRYEREGAFPFVQTSAAMLMVFIAVGKVHSPQYALWVLPFLALVKLRPIWWWAFTLTDAWLYAQWIVMPYIDQARWLEMSAVVASDVVLLLLARAAVSAGVAFVDAHPPMPVAEATVRPSVCPVTTLIPAGA